ncbi:MAG: class IV adenylate cyclase [Nanoarchaeota archaeon]|nr:class IV adenylate cyclase [Nanoarchaeota archaeon]MBU1854209.1 class IV adenylate cyclase [Nanoarchaeota archaeon]
MREIEVKILEVNRAELEKKLFSLGAKKTFEGLIHGFYFDDDVKSVRKAKNTLRLRTEGDKVMLAFKKYVKKDEVKVRDEFQVEVSNFESMKLILEMLGFHAFKEFKKKRVSYAIGSVNFEFDVLQNYDVPEFLEIEAEDSETVFRYAELLGFSKSDCKCWDGKDLIRHYGFD